MLAGRFWSGLQALQNSSPPKGCPNPNKDGLLGWMCLCCIMGLEICSAGAPWPATSAEVAGSLCDVGEKKGPTCAWQAGLLGEPHAHPVALDARVLKGFAHTVQLIIGCGGGHGNNRQQLATTGTDWQRPARCCGWWGWGVILLKLVFLAGWTFLEWPAGPPKFKPPQGLPKP